MGIEKIKNNVDGITSPKLLSGKAVRNRVYMGIPQDSTSFTGNAATAAAPAAVKPLKELLLDIMPNVAKRMVKIHEGMGEIQNQLINAIGTGLIAPLFIKYNPLSDTDEDTRTYTAWRQPVSAVLAVATQCAIVIPFNAIIRNASDTGYMPMHVNASLFPSDKFLKGIVKANNPGKSFTKDEMKKEIEALKKQNDKTLEDMIKNDNIIFKTTDGKTASNLEMPKEDFKKLFAETIDTIIKDEANEKIKVIQNKLPHKIERGIFYHNYPEESKAVLQRLNNKISQFYAQTDFTNGADKFIIANREFDLECKNTIKDLKAEIKQNPAKKELNNELIKIVKEIQSKNTGTDSSAIRMLGNKIGKMLDSVETMKAKKSTQEIIEYVNNAIYMRTNAIDETISTLTKIRKKLDTSGITVQEAQQIIDETIHNSRSSVVNKLKARGLNESEMKESVELIENVSTRLKQKAGSIAKCIGDQLKKHVKSNIDGVKRWTGLGVSLAILPVTCWMLNKIYPWFMDKAFPNLSNKAASAQEDKNKKAEVK